jgi:hypothetical protein
VSPDAPSCDLNGVQVNARATPTIAEVIRSISSPPRSGCERGFHLRKHITLDHCRYL